MGLNRQLINRIKEGIFAGPKGSEEVKHMYRTKKFIVSIDEDGRVAIADSKRTNSMNCSLPSFLRSFLLFSFHRFSFE